MSDLRLMYNMVLKFIPSRGKPMEMIHLIMLSRKEAEFPRCST